MSSTRSQAYAFNSKIRITIKNPKMGNQVKSHAKIHTLEIPSMEIEVSTEFSNLG